MTLTAAERNPQQENKMADLRMNIASCAELLAKARADFNSAESEHKQSERLMTDARERLNEAQKTFDEAIAELKADAPWNTKWHAERNPPQRVHG